MDLWVVAAATGAGFLAKYLQNSVGEKEELSESLSQIWDQTWPFCRLVPTKGSKFEDVSSRRDDDVANGSRELSDILTLTRLQENVRETSENTDFLDNGCDVLGELETNRLTRNGPIRNRRARMFSIKPLSPLESCVTFQLNKEKIVKKGYIFSPPPSPLTPSTGPLIVNGIVTGDTRVSFGDFVNGGDDRFSLGEKGKLLRSLLSRQSGLLELPRTRKHKVGKERLSVVASGGSLLSQGLLNGMVLFFAGITIGIISSVIKNKRELDNLNAQLKQKENLVRDLHDEIEMRERLTVKEISYEDNQSLESTNHSSDWELVASSSKNDLEESTNNGSKKFDDQNVANPELMSKIEAELEAELEKLEVNITSSGFEGISDYVELDPDIEADVVRGDLKVYMARPADVSQPESDNDASGTSTNHTHPSNYAVSPWELSLRLHEVIESRLSVRIEELEKAIRNSRKKHSIEWLRIISSRGLDNGEVGSSFTPETQTEMYDVHDMDPPVGMGLSGEASDVYNESYEEVVTKADSNEETPY